MGQVMAFLIIILIIIFVFVPLSFLNHTHFESREIKQDINLSAKVLQNCVSCDIHNLEALSEGYERKKEIEIDKERLLKEFNEALYENILDWDRFDKIKKRIRLKVLTYKDCFYIEEGSNQWGPPFFFTFWHPSFGVVSLEINNPQGYYYDGKTRTSVPLEFLGLDEEGRDEIILSAINQKVAQYTYEPGERESLGIEIGNRYGKDRKNTLENTYFNVLEGITFFVVYAEDTQFQLHSQDYHFKNYNVTGYTLFLGSKKA